MAVLVDSNILLRSLHPGHPHFAIAENSVAALRLRNETLCIAPQILVEFWAVATRPRDDNGLGLAPDRAAAELVSLRRLFRLLV
jgi:predicted nucleic acid-binding protein